MDLERLSSLVDVERVSDIVRELWAKYAPPRWVAIPFGASFTVCYVYYKFSTWHYGIFKKMGIKGPKPSLPLGTMSSMLKKNIPWPDACLGCI